jgi:hypothetical protein
MPDWVKRSVDEWAALAAITSGPLFRAINKAGRVWGNGFTPKVIWSIVKEGAVGCGLTGLAPHDLGRTLPDCAIRLAVSSNRSSFSSDTFQSKPQNGIWAVSRVFKML